MKKAKKILKKADELYDKKEWSVALDLIDENIILFKRRKDLLMKAYKLLGWILYYLAIKQKSEAEKENFLYKAKDVFGVTLKEAKNKKIRRSALSGLPLVLWILKEKESAWKVSREALAEFPNDASIWNTMSILYRWMGNLKDSINACEKVSHLALKRGNFRLAGHAQQNKGDALVKIGNNEEAKAAYAGAIVMYRKGGESFHSESAEKKLAELKK